MCLGMPGQVVTVLDDARMLALVELDGVQRGISLEMLDPGADVHVGDWLLAHLGFAVRRLDEQEAAEALAWLKFFRDPDASPEDVPGAER